MADFRTTNKSRFNTKGHWLALHQLRISSPQSFHVSSKVNTTIVFLLAHVTVHCKHSANNVQGTISTSHCFISFL